MIQTEIETPKMIIIREIRIQEVLHNNEVTIAVINKSKIPTNEANEMLAVANYIINNFKI